ncbi:recombinase RecT [Polynucleobacter sp. AP-Titi-500A-B4]|uniref:recombinase RecT n=1 Tax=Polynucleobacter sp. AP-Titi-500A-B4 TaxID=2576923 RepID=UPI001BFD9DDA|nr:recombinase RecT [Polynucleobacter sp. AP-Titi-500A-B4]
MSSTQLSGQASISVNGWIKRLHRHPAFSGITFTQSPELSDLQDLQSPQTSQNTWMERTIYRPDGIMPTTVREYLSEVQNQGEVWKKMPKRMLRHRVLQQCARLAMGINVCNTNERSDKPRSKNKTMTPDPHQQANKKIIQEPNQQFKHTEKLKQMLQLSI